MTCLLSISIGPVQDFIAAARKTGDLWAGSQLLSDISAEAARALQQSGCDLIFPAPSALGASDRSVPNRLLAIVKSEAPESAARKAREACDNLLLQKMEGALEQAPQADREACLSQLKSFLEFYAAWWPLSNGDFAEARERVEQLMAGRKALRDFQPSPGRAGVPKSSLDPGRDAVLIANKLSDSERQRLRVKRGEMLDAVSLLKRLCETPRFVSTARVAADPFVRRFNGSAGLQRLNDIADKLEQMGSDLCSRVGGVQQYEAFPYDTHLFFGDAKSERDEAEHAKELARDFYEAVCKICAQEHVPCPLPYYAILAADGDGMGEMVSSKAREGQEALRKFSEDLSNFGARARAIIEKHHGAAVYCGGDDVLAFLPLDTALFCADELRGLFHYKTGGTMSIGIALAHFGAYLQTAVRWAREAERDAKGLPGKNALSVHLHTRTAGEECVSARHSWKDDPVNNRWKVWLELIEQRRLPSQAAYQLRQLAREFKEFTGKEQSQALRAEARRILSRKTAGGGEGKLEDEDINRVVEAAGGADMTWESLNNAVNEILICRRIAQAVALSGGIGEQQ